MLTRLTLSLPALLVAAVCCFAAGIARAAPPPTINYQGYLTNPGGTPVNTAVVMTFKLYNAAVGGAPLYTETQLSVPVSNGNFNALIGAQTLIALPFDVQYWLTVAVNADAEMSPRQPLTSSPYAFRAASLDGAATVTSAQIIGTITTTQLADGAVTAAKLASSGCANGQVLQFNGVAWVCATAAGPAGPPGNTGPQGPAGPGTVASITAGNGLTGGTITTTGTIAVDPTSSVLTGNFFKQGGNAYPGTATLGSTNNVPVAIIANGSPAVRIAPTADGPNIALGHALNVAGGVGVQAATVSGGGVASFPNVATALYATVGGGINNKAQEVGGTVGGGRDNIVSGVYATVGGGFVNTASGFLATVSGGENNIASGAEASTVGGGQLNIASGNRATIGGGTRHAASGNFSFIGGGFLNTASNTTATVSGGSGNIASGDSATVPGGHTNTALGAYSFAAGRRAKSNNDGCFTWADSTDADFACTTNNAFVARATGGVYLLTNAAITTGCNIPAGGGAWACTSSRETKTDFTTMNPVDVLTRVAGLPMTKWRYRTEASGARHVGPMAEDFHAAFGLGDSTKTINVMDASGIALAAIQGLNQLVVKKDAEIKTQGKRIKMLEDALAAIQARLGMR